jgi:hypothetical protein
MAYISQEDKAKIAAQIKPLLKQYGVKGSLSIQNHSTIVLTLKSGSIDFIGNYNATIKERDPSGNRRINPAKDSINVNVYWCHEHFTGVAKKFLTEAVAALKSAGWYDNSDAMTDYFNTAYYMDINIGKWDKPYIVE